MGILIISSHVQIAISAPQLHSGRFLKKHNNYYLWRCRWSLRTCASSTAAYTFPPVRHEGLILVSKQRVLHLMHAHRTLLNAAILRKPKREDAGVVLFPLSDLPQVLAALDYYLCFSRCTFSLSSTHLHLSLIKRFIH